jgi:hypothetical protein
VAGAGALLLQSADAQNILSDLSTQESRRGKALLMRALLMAGATKEEFAGIGGWRKGFAVPSADGSVPLDYRFGAGELNVDNSHIILSAGRHVPGSAADVPVTGWDYRQIAASATHSYFFSVTYVRSLSVVVVWNRQITQQGPNLTPQLANIDLRLFAAESFVKGALLDRSVSTLDNVEHIHVVNMPQRRLAIEVASNLAWSYAIAWHAQIAPTVLPDLDGDGDVDSGDLGAFQACASGPSLPVSAGCEATDFDQDGDADQADFGRMQRCLSGVNVLADPVCAN